MRIHLINPNTTVSMTDKAAAAARAVAAPGTEIIAATSKNGPASIEGAYDGAIAVPGMLLAMKEAEESGVDGHILACFDDTGIDAARALAKGPVIGIGQAAFHVASLITHRFSVVTTLSRSIPVIEGNLVAYGLATRCTRVRASDIPVLDLEKPGSGARDTISAEIAAALKTDGAEGIVLGCAGMADLAADLSAEHGVPVIEGVGCAVKLMEALLGLKAATAKTGLWSAPLPKSYSGFMTPLAPKG
ncbi:Hydantoin racemase [Hartmannibacter diazotrophicus]|uniref:Hydantoin racemase n=1 Tax=Hartmannibacter diazotrophicus TaxID=1482074 RepID=A0A2C9DBJ3_9HYPH|nr:aspartate/glutamate racemase family protein [Hartmannibacter diazotrophicus]SON57101.1 Hydantoin racemase [Hartmannibacter diazotrophicus]